MVLVLEEVKAALFPQYWGAVAGCLPVKDAVPVTLCARLYSAQCMSCLCLCLVSSPTPLSYLYPHAWFLALPPRLCLAFPPTLLSCLCPPHLCHVSSHLSPHLSCLFFPRLCFCLSYACVMFLLPRLCLVSSPTPVSCVCPHGCVFPLPLRLHSLYPRLCLVFAPKSPRQSYRRSHVSPIYPITPVSFTPMSVFCLLPHCLASALMHLWSLPPPA